MASEPSDALIAEARPTCRCGDEWNAALEYKCATCDMTDRQDAEREAVSAERGRLRSLIDGVPSDAWPPPRCRRARWHGEAMTEADLDALVARVRDVQREIGATPSDTQAMLAAIDDLRARLAVVERERDEALTSRGQAVRCAEYEHEHRVKAEAKLSDMLDMLRDAKQYITPTISTHEDIAELLRTERDEWCDCGYCPKRPDTASGPEGGE